MNDEVVSVIAKFFDAGSGPSHDVLTRLFSRANVTGLDPHQPGDNIGKMKRVREVLLQLIDKDQVATVALVKSILAAIRGEGAFRPGSPGYAGVELVAAARSAFRGCGYDLDPEGNLLPRVLEKLDGSDLTDALRAYVRRAQAGSLDDAQLVGTAKDLIEACARHVLVMATGSYPTSADFRTTLYQCYDRLGYRPAEQAVATLDSDPHIALQQALYVMAVTVNRLRNREGAGHGRPDVPTLTKSEAIVSIEAMGVVAGYLLDAVAPTK